MKNTEFELDIVRSHADVLHSRKKAGTLRTFYQALRRLLYALGGKATDADNTDVTLIERMAEVAEGGGISPSASGLPNHDRLVVIPGTSIGSVSGESRLAKLQRAISRGVIPIGETFTGYFISSARYYCNGYLYSSGNKLYGSVTLSAYNRAEEYNVEADVWTITYINQGSSTQPITIWRSTENESSRLGLIISRNYIGLYDNTNSVWIWRTPFFPSENAFAVWPISMGGTGGTTAADARTTLSVPEISTTIQLKGALPTNTDLNTIRDSGIYSLSGNNTFYNMPSGITYGLLVVATISTFSFQELTTNAGRTFKRLYANNAWSTWREL